MKKILNLPLILILTALLFISCNKDNSEVVVPHNPKVFESEKPENSSQSDPSNFLVENVSNAYLNDFFSSQKFGEFDIDNPTIVSSMLVDSARRVSYTDMNTRQDMLMFYIPLNISGENSSIIIIATKDAVASADYESFVLSYQKELQTYINSDGTRYGTVKTEIYRSNFSVVISENAVGEVTSYSLDSTSGTTLNCPTYRAALGPVVPTAACINTGFDNLQASCTGGCLVARRIANLFGNVWDAADLASAILFCATHNNNPIVVL